MGAGQLTYATLGAFLKYPWSSRKRGKKKKEKFGAFLSEEPILDDVAKELGLVKRGDHVWSRHPLAYLVEAADDICYAIIDLEDAVELNILPFGRVANLLLNSFNEKEKMRIRATFAAPESHRVNFARLRGPLFDQLVEAAIEGFMNGYNRIMQGTCADNENVFSFLSRADKRKKLISRAKRRATYEVFPDQKKIELELGSYAIFDCLLSAFCEAATVRAQAVPSLRTRAAIKSKTDLVIRLLADHAPYRGNAPPGSSWTEYQCLRRIIDFVSGMTDNYATYIAKQLQGMGSGGVQRP